MCIACEDLLFLGFFFERKRHFKLLRTLYPHTSCINLASKLVLCYHHWRRAFQLKTFGRKYSRTFQCAAVRQMGIDLFILYPHTVRTGYEEQHCLPERSIDFSSMFFKCNRYRSRIVFLRLHHHPNTGWLDSWPLWRQDCLRGRSSWHDHSYPGHPGGSSGERLAFCCSADPWRDWRGTIMSVNLLVKALEKTQVASISLVKNANW